MTEMKTLEAGLRQNLYRIVLYLCLPAITGWLGFGLTRLFHNWDGNPLTSWPIFILLMFGYVSVFSDILALAIAVADVLLNKGILTAKIILFAIVAIAFASTYVFYGIALRGM